jgi:hypothetical protein
MKKRKLLCLGIQKAFLYSGISQQEVDSIKNKVLEGNFFLSPFTLAFLDRGENDGKLFVMDPP